MSVMASQTPPLHITLRPMSAMASQTPPLHITLRPHERHDVSNTTITYYIEAT